MIEVTENEIKIRKVFSSSSFLLTSKTLSSRSGNRNSFKTTFYFRAINFLKKDKKSIKKKNPKAGRV